MGGKEAKGKGGDGRREAFAPSLKAQQCAPVPSPPALYLFWDFPIFCRALRAGTARGLVTWDASGLRGRGPVS